jgi:serine/threonine protein kinase
VAKKNKKRELSVDSFDLAPGRVLARKYEVISLLGSGWEGEVYKIREHNTGIERAAKLFFPQRNLRNKTSSFYARKLHKLRHCPIIIQYYTEETIKFRGSWITVLVSEYVEGDLLSEFLKRQPGKRLNPFQAVHLLHALVVGIESVHRLREYHGDLHPENIIVSRYGLSFELKLLDMFYWKSPKRENIQDDICDLVRIFYDALGGASYYARQPDEVKSICLGLKRSLILEHFPTASHLRQHLETMQWQ